MRALIRIRALIGIVLKHVNKLNIVKRARLLSSHP